MGYQAPANHALAKVINEADVSAVGLARRIQAVAAQWGLQVYTAHTQVGRWLNGQQPREPTPSLIAEALSQKLGRRVTLADIGMDRAGSYSPELGLDFAADAGEAIRALTDLWTADVERRDFLRSTIVASALTGPALSWLLARSAGPSTTGGPRRVGMADVAAVNTTAAMFADLDNRFGGGAARSAAVQYLSDQVTPMLHGSYTDAVGRELYTAVAAFTLSVAWMGYDSGDQWLARRYFIQALTLAHYAGNRELGASALSAMSHQANYLGDHTEALQLARAARHGSAGSPSQASSAQFAAMEARAAASMGQRADTMRALGEAQSAFDRRDAESDPDWMVYFDESELADEIAHCYRDLGDYDRALFAAGQCLTLAGPEYARSRVFSRIVQAESFLGAGEPEQAARIGIEVIPLVQDLASVRVAGYLATLRTRAAPYNALPVVAGFTDRARIALDGRKLR